MRTTTSIYDINDRLVANLEEGYISVGKHEITWNLDDKNGSKVKAGLYLCIIRSCSFQKSIRIIIK
jgi:flagellar hook assembly protein FlgD